MECTYSTDVGDVTVLMTQVMGKMTDILSIYYVRETRTAILQNLKGRVSIFYSVSEREHFLSHSVNISSLPASCPSHEDAVKKNLIFIHSSGSLHLKL